MKNDPIRTKVLSIRLIPNADRFLLKAMQVQEGHRSLGLITTDCDDVSYAALDEATKKADVSVAYARSMYAGSSNASTALAGEFIGILSGENPEDVKSGLAAVTSTLAFSARAAGRVGRPSSSAVLMILSGSRSAAMSSSSDTYSTHSSKGTRFCRTISVGASTGRFSRMRITGPYMRIM